MIAGASRKNTGCLSPSKLQSVMTSCPGASTSIRLVVPDPGINNRFSIRKFEVMVKVPFDSTWELLPIIAS